MAVCWRTPDSAVRIDTYADFVHKTRGCASPKDVKLKDWVFQGVDFTNDSLENFKQYNVEKAIFLGCTFPSGVSTTMLQTKYDLIN